VITNPSEEQDATYFSTDRNNRQQFQNTLKTKSYLSPPSTHTLLIF